MSNEFFKKNQKNLPSLQANSIEHAVILACQKYYGHEKEEYRNLYARIINKNPKVQFLGELGKKQWSRKALCAADAWINQEEIEIVITCLAQADASWLEELAGINLFFSATKEIKKHLEKLPLTGGIPNYMRNKTYKIPPPAPAGTNWPYRAITITGQL